MDITCNTQFFMQPKRVLSGWKFQKEIPWISEKTSLLLGFPGASLSTSPLPPLGVPPQVAPLLLAAPPSPLAMWGSPSPVLRLWLSKQPIEVESRRPPAAPRHEALLFQLLFHSADLKNNFWTFPVPWVHSCKIGTLGSHRLLWRFQWVNKKYVGTSLVVHC